MEWWVLSQSSVTNFDINLSPSLNTTLPKPTTTPVWENGENKFKKSYLLLIINIKSVNGDSVIFHMYTSLLVYKIYNIERKKEKVFHQSFYIFHSNNKCRRLKSPYPLTRIKFVGYIRGSTNKRHPVIKSSFFFFLVIDMFLYLY